MCGHAAVPDGTIRGVYVGATIRIPSRPGRHPAHGAATSRHTDGSRSIPVGRRAFCSSIPNHVGPSSTGVAVDGPSWRPYASRDEQRAHGRRAVINNIDCQQFLSTVRVAPSGLIRSRARARTHTYPVSMALPVPALGGFPALSCDFDAGILSAVADLALSCNRPGPPRFPFGNPVSMEHHHVDLVKGRQYYITEKADGIRVACVLFHTRDAHFAVLWDRLGKVYGISVAADAVLFEGTFLDAELVRVSPTTAGTRDTYQLLLFDVACVGGQRAVADLPLPDRLAVLAEAVVPHLTCGHGTGVVLDVRVKRMWPVADTHASALTAHVASLPYASDGYILTPVADGVAPCGTAPSVLKLKFTHTVDCLWAGGRLWFGDGHEHFPVEHLSLRLDARQYAGAPEGCIVEVAVDPDRGLHYVQVRRDKNAPNAYQTVVRTVQSALDNVKLETVMAP